LAELKFQEISRNQAQSLNADLEYATGVLYTLRAHYLATDHAISRAEFQSFVLSLRKRLVGLRNTGWAIRVTRENRDAFERSVRAEGFPSFEIWERGADGNRVRAGDRLEYFPILYPDPVEITPQVLGFDIASEALRNDALQRARSSGLPAATPPINLITKNEPEGFMSFIPVYGNELPSAGIERAPRGYMYGVFATRPMVENMLSARAVPAGLDIYFFNRDGEPGNRRIYWHSGGAADAPV